MGHVDGCGVKCAGKLPASLILGDLQHVDKGNL